MLGSPRRAEHHGLPPAGIMQGMLKPSLPSFLLILRLLMAQQSFCNTKPKTLSGVVTVAGDTDFHLGGTVDVQGVCKSTIVRGEDDFPSGTMRVTDCHDTTIYALAPMQ